MSRPKKDETHAEEWQAGTLVVTSHEARPSSLGIAGLRMAKRESFHLSYTNDHAANSVSSARRTTRLK